MIKMIYVKYICNQCKAEDTDKFFPDEQPHMALSCYKCHAGQGLDIGNMMAQGKGMFPEKSRRLPT
jgi:hypothetical protein